MRLKHKNKTLQNKLLTAVRNKVYENNGVKRIDNKLDKLVDEIYSYLNNAFSQTAEFESLLSGKLRADFGLSEEVRSILPTIFIDLVEVFYQVVISDKDNDVYNIEIVVKAREENDPYMQSAINRCSYISKSSGELIEWLRWLLFAGTNTVIANYKVTYWSNKGRSGMAFMRKKDGAEFSVDPLFAGTAQDNMVTKLINSNKDKFKEILRKYLNVSN